MRALRVPVFVLLFLFAASLCSCLRMNTLCRRWAQALDNTQKAVTQYDFAAADKALQELEMDWQGRQIYLHVTIAHDEIDRAGELMALCRLQVEEKDAPAFLASATRLQTQFDLLREIENLSIRNIL